MRLSYFSFGAWLFGCSVAVIFAGGSVSVEADTDTSGHAAEGGVVSDEKVMDLDPHRIRQLAEDRPRGADAPTPEHLRLDPIFAEFPDLFRSPDIEYDALTEIEQRRERAFQAQFELGLQHRRAKDYDFAVSAFVRLLEKRPPESYRQQAMLQLALIAELREEWVKAQQIYRHYESLFPNDRNLPLVSLRLGLIYRQLGADELALSQLHSIILASVRSQSIDGPYFSLYRRIVLKAKTEIANTHLGNGDYDIAARHYRMLISEDAKDDAMARINRPVVRFKLCKCLSVLEDHAGLEWEVEAFLAEHKGHALEADIRFLAVRSLQARQRNDEVLEHFQRILELPLDEEAVTLVSGRRWRLRIGMEVAAQMMAAGNFLDALQIYESLDALIETDLDQVSVLYQTGLAYERLHQPDRALTVYEGIRERLEADAELQASPAGHLIADLAGWRGGLLDWYRKKRLVLEEMRDKNRGILKPQ